MRIEVKILLSCLISLCHSESCGISKSDSWPWSVSLFYGDSNVLECQGTLISRKHVVTAGHCLNNKDANKFTLHPGMNFYKGDEKISWKLSKLDVHPDMKLGERNKFIDGGFMSSMVTQADIAVATLQTEIELSDTISPICLPGENKSNSTIAQGRYSGWSVTHKKVEHFNSSFFLNDNDEFNDVRPQGNIEFAEGTGMFVKNLNSPWTINGILSMEDYSTKGEKNLVFVNVAVYRDWITKIASENLTKINNDSLKATMKSTLSVNLTTMTVPNVHSLPTSQIKATTPTKLENTSVPPEVKRETTKNLVTSKTEQEKLTETSTLSSPTTTPSESLNSTLERAAKALSINSSEISPMLKNVESFMKGNESSLMKSDASNATSETVEKKPLLAVIPLPPWMIITGIFLGSILFLFTVFAILARGKPEHH